MKGRSQWKLRSYSGKNGIRRVKGLFPTLHGYQQKLWALLVAGMVVSGCGVLQRVAEDREQQGWSEAKMSSIQRRLERFLANDQIVVNEVWKTFMGEVLPYWQGKKLTFVLDCTPSNAQFTIVYLGLLVHSRVLPVAWTVMPQQEQWEERQWDIVARLLETVRVFLPETECTLLADRGLAGAPLVRRMSSNATGMTCCASVRSRPVGDKWANRKNGAAGVPRKSFIHKKGQQWYGRALVWQEESIETSVSACWEEESQEAWLIMRGSARWQEAASDLCVADACRIHLSGYVRPGAGTSKPRNSKCASIWNACC